MNTKSMITSCLLVLLAIGLNASARSEETPDTWEKVVFHLDEKRNARWALMLAHSYLDDRPNAKVIVVAYGPGIDFLVKDAQDSRGNPYAADVQELDAAGVGFRVCAETLDAKKVSKDDLLDEVSIVPSGISEIVRLQIKDGYAYLKP